VLCCFVVSVSAEVNGKRVACVIPARLASTRFPRKVLANLGPKPLLQWVWEAANSCQEFDEIVFAVDSDETAHLIEGFGGKWVMTSPDCASGTDRMIALRDLTGMEADVWVNWQGDEPFICGDMISTLLNTVGDDADMWSLRKRILRPSEITDPNVVKVVVDKSGRALYFSRFPIPYIRDREMEGNVTYFKHIGIYAYTDRALDQIKLLKRSMLEKAESLEQLRMMEDGFVIRVHETQFETIGIDHPADLDLAEKWARDHYR